MNGLPPHGPAIGTPLTREELSRIPAGASSESALLRATGGSIETLGGIERRNALVLHMDGRRFVYVRPQALAQNRSTAYGPHHLRKMLDPGNALVGHDLDHVASTGVEGKRMGMGYVLVAFVPKSVNQSYGYTNEKGPSPLRESAKAFQGGIDHEGEHHVTYLTQEMVDKLSGKHAAGRGHSTFRTIPSPEELDTITHALMQSAPQRDHVRTLTGAGTQMTRSPSGPSRPIRR